MRLLSDSTTAGRDALNRARGSVILFDWRWREHRVDVVENLGIGPGVVEAGTRTGHTPQRPQSNFGFGGLQQQAERVDYR